MNSAHSRKMLVMLVACLGYAALCCVPAFTQVLNLADGPTKVVLKFDLPRAAGRAPVSEASTAARDIRAAAFDATSPTSSGLQAYTANYTSLAGKQLPFNIVGTDPSLGENTTTVPTVLVPLQFIFSNTTLDGTNVKSATQNSPIFQNADYTAGSVELGVTQFGDAFQRAQFWNLPRFSRNYHVLLGSPTVAPTVTITVPSDKGTASPLAGGGFVGVIDFVFFEQLVVTLTSDYTANELPIFLTDNVYLSENGLQNCCILGFHASEGAPIATAKTWIYAAYAEPGSFAGDVVLDVDPLSHEVAEWLNDPFINSTNGTNWIPPAVLPGQGGACISNFETADPLESVPFTFTKVTNGTTYHLQDQVTLPWYLHTTPSFSANGWYTFQNTSATIPLVINPPSSIAGSYTNTATLPFAPVDKAVTGNIAYVGQGCPAGSINPGSPADPYLADPSGKIALIDRGACAVSLKIDRAAQAGATGVLIGLIAPGDATFFDYGGGTHFVPSLVITQSTSNLIKDALGSSPGATVNATISPANAIPPSFSALCGPG